jgi:hypothetical protein
MLITNYTNQPSFSKSPTSPDRVATLKSEGSGLRSTRAEDFEQTDRFVTLSFPKTVVNEQAQIPPDAAYTKAEAKKPASSLKSMVERATPVTGEKVTVSPTGALYVESEPPPNPWQPSSFAQAVEYRKDCIERHRQTIEVLVDARAQGNVPESHLQKLEKAMIEADEKVFAAMKVCNQFPRQPSS